MLFEKGGRMAGYALLRREPEWVYLRQLFVRTEYRRRWVASAALAWLRAHAWADAPRVRIDVLVGNTVAIEFRRPAGYLDYCLTIKWEPTR